jgi:hypothetical protein
MKFIITENQYRKLLVEQTVYTDLKKYKKALAEYENLMIIYTYFKEGKEFFISQVEPLLNQVKTFGDAKYKQSLKLFITKPQLFCVPWMFSGMKKYFPKNVMDAMEALGGESKFLKKIKYIVPHSKKSDSIYYGWLYDDDVTYSSTEESAVAFGYNWIHRPQKPVYKAPEPVKRQTPKPNPPVINKPPVVNPPVNDNPVVIPPKKVEPLNTKFSATFGQDGKQETRYFKNFDEWNRFYESVKGKFGFMNGNHNKSKTEASMLLKGVPSDWGL